MDEIEEGRPIAFDDVRRQILEAKKAGYTRVDFFGGEPTTYPFLAEAFGLAADLGLEAMLATNAVRFASAAYARSFFRRARPLAVRVSLYSHDAGFHDRVTALPGSFVKTLAGIRNILKHHERLGVSVLILSENAGRLAEIVELVHGLGCPGIKFIGLIETDRTGHAYPELAYDLGALEKPLAAAIRAAERRGMLVQLEKLPVCIAPGRAERFVQEAPDETFFKAPFCRLCRLEPFCPGLSKPAIERGGIPPFARPIA
jgi:MoaA/NifB/PqqE/SkfB family radical SAM enzyme